MYVLDMRLFAYVLLRDHMAYSEISLKIFICFSQYCNS